MTSKPSRETEAIRSDIEMTRRRMDDTIDALGERVRGRHLLDEVIGFFRHNADATSETSSRVREKLSETAGKISDSAGNAATAVADTVKKNPLPFLLITAGAAWLAYSATRGRKADIDEDTEDSDRYDPDTHYDRPLDYTDTASESTEGLTDEAGSTFASMKDKAAAAKEQMKQKVSEFSDTAKEKFQSVRDRAGEIGAQVQDRTREMYGKTKDTVVRTADEHPLELGLGCLAVGVLVGLALPTPDPVNRVAGPTVERLRNRTRDAGRDMLEKGKRVMQAATSAARQEAESQGLTVDRLRHATKKVADQAEAAARDEAQDEGMMSETGNQRAGAEPADPSAARPAM